MVDMTDSQVVMIRGHGDNFYRNMHLLNMVVYKKLCYLLFSISVAIGQFSSNWPSCSCTVILAQLISLFVYKNLVFE